jgi:hypothetical protein
MKMSIRWLRMWLRLFLNSIVKNESYKLLVIVKRKSIFFFSNGNKVVVKAGRIYFMTQTNWIRQATWFLLFFCAAVHLFRKKIMWWKVNWEAAFLPSNCAMYSFNDLMSNGIAIEHKQAACCEWDPFFVLI